MTTPLVRISYKNISGSTVPPYGILQLTGAGVLLANGQYVFQATTPGSGTGPYVVDDGGGATTSGPKQYGSCVRAVDGSCWASYSGAAPTNWQEMGPVSGSFLLGLTGTGFFYGGVQDSTNNRILVTAKPSAGLATYICTQLNAGANVAVYREPVSTFNANPSYPTFNAQPWDPSVTTTLAAINHALDVSVSSTCLTGTVFTGQVFAVSVGTPKIAIGGDGIQYRGTVVSVSGATVTVTIPYLSNITTAQTVTLVATNDTGIALVAGQLVIVELVNILGTTTSRYRVAEYQC